jgi:hypothetical protein
MKGQNQAFDDPRELIGCLFCQSWKRTPNLVIDGMR